MSTSTVLGVFTASLISHRNRPRRAPRHLQGSAQREDGPLAHEQHRLALSRGGAAEVSVPNFAVEGRLVIGIGQLVDYCVVVCTASASAAGTESTLGVT